MDLRSFASITLPTRKMSSILPHKTVPCFRFIFALVFFYIGILPQFRFVTGLIRRNVNSIKAERHVTPEVYITRANDINERILRAIITSSHYY